MSKYILENTSRNFPFGSPFTPISMSESSRIFPVTSEPNKKIASHPSFFSKFVAFCISFHISRLTVSLYQTIPSTRLMTNDIRLSRTFSLLLIPSHCIPLTLRRILFLFPRSSRTLGSIAAAPV